MTRCIRSYIPNVALSFGALVRYGFWFGQSNDVGPSPNFVLQNQLDVPHLYNSYTLSEGVQGIWLPNGCMDGDQSYPQLSYKGTQQQWGTDIKAAGKKPALVTGAKSGTSIVEFINGSATDVAFTKTLSNAAAMTAGAPLPWNCFSIWGEADANQLATSLAFGANLVTIAAKIRAFLPGARFYITLLNINYDNGQGPPNDALWRGNVRTGQTNFVAGDSNAELRNWDAFPYVSPHYTDAGLDMGGSDFATSTLIYQP